MIGRDSFSPAAALRSASRWASLKTGDSSTASRM